MRRTMRKAVGILFTVGLMTGCGGDSPTGPDAAGGSLSLSLNGLESLGSGFAFEGWVVVDGSPISTGVFTVDASGSPSRASFDVDSGELARATRFILTIEPSPDPDPAPSATKYLAGDFNGSSASLSSAHPAALGDDFQTAAGRFILETPSSASDPTDYASGIWWLDPSGGPGPGLTLPMLPEGWVYEGWVVGPGGPVTTGRFASPVGSDSDGAGPAAGPDGTPPFPGQDFVDPRSVLTGYAAVISIEPEPDDSAGPFTLKPLVDDDIEDLGAGGIQSMANVAGDFPTGVATR